MGFWDDLRRFLLGESAEPPEDDPEDDVPPIPEDRAEAFEVVLRNELDDDPEGIGYAAMLAEQDDGGLAQALNAVRSDTLVPKGVVSRDAFVGDAFVVIERIYALAAGATRNKWMARLELLKLKDTLNLGSVKVLAMLLDLIPDGLATQAEVDALTLRAGSRAEFLFGRAVTAGEISDLLRPERETAYQQAQAAIQARADELRAANPALTERQARQQADEELRNG